MEVFVREKGAIRKKEIDIKYPDNLELLTNNDVYRNNWRVADIGPRKGQEYVEFMNGKVVTIDAPIRRFQIRQIIQEHLDKEKRLNKRGLKVLSLFFVDRVANYREYDENGNARLGVFGRMFEEEYEKLIRSPRYRDLWEDELKDVNRHVSEVHDGYFSMDRRAKASNKKDKFDAWTDTSGTIKKDNDTYELILRRPVFERMQTGLGGNSEQQRLESEVPLTHLDLQFF